MDPRDRSALERAVASARIALDHARSGGSAWPEDQKTVDAVAKRVGEVAEQLKRVSLGQQAAMPSVPWREAKGIRERLAHDSFQVDSAILERVVERDLPALIIAIETELEARTNSQTIEPSGPGA
jgi:uncharacterized protein with HEPN domain